MISRIRCAGTYHVLLEVAKGELAGSGDVGAERPLFADHDDTTAARRLLLVDLEPARDARALDCLREGLAGRVVADAAEVSDLAARVRVSLSAGRVERRAAWGRDLAVHGPKLVVERHLLLRDQRSHTELELVLVEDGPLVVGDRDVEDGVTEVHRVNLVACLSHHPR